MTETIGPAVFFFSGPIANRRIGETMRKNVFINSNENEMTVGIISYNIHCVPVAGGCPTGHLENVAAYVNSLAIEHDASIFIFNELFVTDARTVLLNRLREGGVVWQMTKVANTPNVGPLASSGVAVAWRPDRVIRTGKMHEIAFKGCCQFDCLAYKGAIHVPFRTMDGHRFHVVGTHMQAWEIPMACAGIRDGQSEQLGNMVSALQSRGTVHSGEPVIMGGDFNETATEGMEARLGASHVSCEGNCKTHASGEFDHFFVRADHSFLSRCSSYTSVNVSGMSNPSDHLPIFMQVDI